MSDFIKKMVRPNIQSLQSYASARGTAKAMEGFTLLDAGENPYSPFVDENNEFLQNLNRYPEPQPQELLDVMSELYETDEKNILITRGSEEGIRLLMQVFCEPRQDSVITCPPTFGLYPIEAQIQDVENVTVPRLGEFKDQLDVDKIVTKGKNPNTKIIFICNPGNPSSTAVDPQQIKSILETLKNDCIIVIDEAYIEFADHDSFVGLLSRYPNLIVLRTLSKSYGLAGLRCGAIIAHTDIIEYLQRVIAAYPVPRSTYKIVTRALSKEGILAAKEKQHIIKRDRDEMISKLKNCNNIKRIYPSQSNFLCLEVDDAQEWIKKFYDKKILIRDRSAAILNVVNIAVGTAEQNQKVLTVLNG